MRTRPPALRTEPSSTYRTPSSRPTRFTSTAWPLYVKLELRAMTKSQRTRDSAVMISSTMPSAKYSCSGSPLILAKDSTAIAGVANPVDPYRPGDVLDLLLPQILEDKGQPVAHLVMNRIGDQHPAGISQGLDPCGDVDAGAIEVVVLDDHVAEIDADTQLDTVVRGDSRVALGHRLLHRDRAAPCIDDAGKFDQQSVAGGLDKAPVVLGDFRSKK